MVGVSDEVLPLIEACPDVAPMEPTQLELRTLDVMRVSEETRPYQFFRISVNAPCQYEGTGFSTATGGSYFQIDMPRIELAWSGPRGFVTPDFRKTIEGAGVMLASDPLPVGWLEQGRTSGSGAADGATTFDAQWASKTWHETIAGDGTTVGHFEAGPATILGVSPQRAQKETSRQFYSGILIGTMSAFVLLLFEMALSRRDEQEPDEDEATPPHPSPLPVEPGEGKATPPAWLVGLVSVAAVIACLPEWRRSWRRR